MTRVLLATDINSKLRFDIAADGPIQTSGWTEILAAMTKGCSAMQVSYTGEAILKISKGGVGLEDEEELPIFITPGCNDAIIPISLAKGKRISVRAEDQDTDLGELIINFLG